MKYRVLGKTGLKISEIGMGTWQLANDENCWVGSDLDESLLALKKYVELGGNFIDTAWIYGFDDTTGKHASEELIGKYLKSSDKRNSLIIASKVPPKNMKWPSWKGVQIDDVFPDKWIIKCVDESLKSLGVDTIDLMQFHVWQDYFLENDGWKETIKNISKAGKVRYWGISANDYQPSNVIKTLATGLISTVQFIFNIFHQKPTENLLPFAKRNNIGLIARVPLDESGLSGKITLETEFADGDLRKKYFGGNRRSELIERTDKLKELLDREAQTLPELALRYLLSFSEVSTVIPGMRKVDHVEANTSVSDGRNLSASLMEILKNFAWERNFYDNKDPSMKDDNYLER